MNFQLKTAKETLNLAFNAFFIDRVCKLSGKELSEVFGYLMGKDISDKSVTGGLINDMEVRANVIAAGIDAFNHKNGNPTHTASAQGFEYLDNLSLIDGQFSEMYAGLISALLPNAGAVEKKAAKVKSKSALKK